MRIRMWLSPATVLAACLSLGLMGCGCSSSSQGVREQERSANTTSEQADVVEDTQEDAQADVQTELGEDVTVSMVNQTGYGIVSIAVKPSVASTYESTHTFDVGEVADGDSAEITFPQVLVGGEPVQDYDILLTTNEESFIEMFDVDILNVHDLALRYENGVGFVEYRTEVGGDMQSTQEEAEQSNLENTMDIETYDQQNQLG